MTRPEKYGLGLVATIGAAALGWAVFGDQGIREVRRLRAERRELAQTVAAHRANRDDLERQVRHLRDDTRTIETRAREELGMIRKGETIFLLPERHDPPR